MKIQRSVVGLLAAAAMASCDKTPSEADKAPAPAPTITVKASGTVAPAVEAAPKPPADSSPTQPK